MFKQMASITVFLCTVSVIINAFGKVDAYLVQSASYSWTGSDIDNIIPRENDDVYPKPHSYFAYSIHDNEDSNYMNTEDKNVIEEVASLGNVDKVSSNRDSGNEAEKSKETSKKEFMKDMHELINTLIQGSTVDSTALTEEQQEEEQDFEVSIPLPSEEFTPDSVKDAELFSLPLPETQKDTTESRPQKELLTSESNPVLITDLQKELSNKGVLMPFKNDHFVQKQKSITSSSKTDENVGTGEIIFEMDLFPVEDTAPSEHMPTQHSDLFLEKHLLPFSFGPRLPDTMLAQSPWQTLAYPTMIYRQRSAPSTKFNLNANKELNHINPGEILHSLKATSIGKVEYLPLGDPLFSLPVNYDDVAHLFGHRPYHNGDASSGALNVGLPHGDISMNKWKDNKYIHQNPRAFMPSVDTVMEVMKPPERPLHRMMLIEPPAVLRIEPVICHRTYKHPQARIIF